MGLKFIRSEKGKQKLCDESNYIYEKHQSNPSKTKTYWRCEQFYKGCKARIHTPYDCDVPEIIFTSGNHNHPGSSSMVEVRSAITNLKEDIHTRGVVTSSREVIASTVDRLSEEARSQLPSTSTISRSIHNWRSQGIPSLPTNRMGFEIPAQFKCLENGSSFLAYDSGADDPERILIFATDLGLNELVENTTWSCDGTFKSSPQLWTQLFTVHIIVKNTFLPRVFSLLPNKREETYKRFFEALLQLRPNICPLNCVVDFEKGIHNALLTVFPNTSIRGCLFHFGQSCWRKICEIGRKTQYNNDPQFALKIKCFNALAFLPPSEVIAAFELLSDDNDIPDEFIGFFESTYIGVYRGRGTNRRRGEPLFSIGLWNVHEQVLQNIPRSNNGAEGFHSALRSSLPTIHPNLWKLCAALQKEESLTQTKMIHITRGDHNNQRNKYKSINARLRHLVECFDCNDDILKFLRGVAYNLH